MDIDTVLYLGLCSIVVLLVITGAADYGAFAGVIIILSLIVLLLIFMLNFADFLIFPFITKHLNVEIMLSKDHRTPNSQNCVLKYVNGLHYATGYLTANVYKYVFASEYAAPLEEGIGDSAEKWERVVMNTKFPFKFSVVSMAEDVQQYRDELEGERGYIEFQMSKEQQATSPNALAIKEMERKLNVIQARIDRISQGELPIYTTMYMETTAVGVSEKEAMDLLNEQLTHLQTAFNIFDLNISRVVGREMHTLHTLNYRVMDVEELKKHFQLQT